MYRLEYGIPQNHTICDYDSFLAVGIMSTSALYIKVPNCPADEDGRYMYLIFPEGENRTEFRLVYIKQSSKFENFNPDIYYNFYNVDVTEFVPTVKICAKNWSR